MTLQSLAVMIQFLAREEEDRWIRGQTQKIAMALIDTEGTKGKLYNLKS